MNYLIVEDERLSADRLGSILKEIDPEAHISGYTTSVKNTVEWLQKNSRPDLIFMDIHLEDDLCFAIFDIFPVEAPVIFTTAYDQYALRAFKSNGVAYLLKPITKADLQEVLSRLAGFSRTAQAESIAKTVKELGHRDEQPKPEMIKRFMIKQGDSLEALPIDQVAYLYSEDHYTFVVARDNRRSIISLPLEELENRLDRSTFFRVSRNAIVSINSVEKVTRVLGRLRLRLRPDFAKDLYVARARMHDFMEWMGMR